MAAYTLADIAKVLGTRYNESSTYTLETHRSADRKLSESSCLKKVGEIKDFTSDDFSTMVIIECPDPKKKTGLRALFNR